MKQAKRKSLTTRYVVLFGAVLFVTNVVLGIVLMMQSTSAIRALVRKNMLNISNTAADILDAQALGALTAKDVGGEEYQEILSDLSVFQSNIDIEYIYAVRQVGEDKFVFTVDADPEDPALYGERVLVTDALRSAAKGVAAVDEAPAADEWGNYYSAYSPVLNQAGNIVGIVGVDFNSEWYDQQIRKNTLSIGVLSVLFVVAGGAAMVVITRQVRGRFNAVGEDLQILSSEMDELMEQITSKPDYRALVERGKEGERVRETGDEVTDELEELGEKIRSMQVEMQRYLDYVRSQAYTDALTGVGNTAAYLALQNVLERSIETQSANFAVAVFDINLLKLINDHHGHQRGDQIIRGAAQAIEDVFGLEQTFRIGGDEFIAVAYEVTPEEMEKRLRAVAQAEERFNREQEGREGKLSLSKGLSLYEREEDRCFKDVFSRADEMMYRQKGEFHRRMGELARRYEWLDE